MVTAIVLTTLGIAVLMYSLCAGNSQPSRLEEVEHECKYNDNVKCYEKCCNFCLVKSECDCCCGGDCKHCGGYSAKVKVNQ